MCSYNQTSQCQGPWFWLSNKEMVDVRKTNFRSVLQQYCMVWCSRLTKENKKDLKRTQKIFIKLILGEKYTTYEETCQHPSWGLLKKKEEEKTHKCAKQTLINEIMVHLLPQRKQLHSINTRKPDYYKVFHGRTERKQKSLGKGPTIKKCMPLVVIIGVLGILRNF